MTADNNDKKREQDRQRQARSRAKRASLGHVRKEYWATVKEHDALATTLEQLRGQDNATD